MTNDQYNDAFNEYRMYIFYVSKKILKNVHDAEDVTIAVFEKAWLYRNYIEHDKVKHFLLTIAKNKSIDLLRSKKRNTFGKYTYVEITPALEEEIEEDESELELMKVEADVYNYFMNRVDELDSDREKEIFKMRFHEMHSVGQIARLLGLKAQTVSNQLCSAIKKLKQKIKLAPFILTITNALFFS